MRFCKSCKSIYTESGPNGDRCTCCGKKLAQITDINEPVRLCVYGGTERAMLSGMLTDADIPFVEVNDVPQGVANELVTGYDVKLNNIVVTVPFQALPKANELLNGIETIDNKIEPMMDDIQAYIERLKAGEIEKKEMSPAMRTTVKVVSAILFLLLIAAVVLGTDKITELIKGLFGG